MRKDWVIKELGDVCTLQRGFDLPKRLRQQGEHPLMSSSGCIDTHVEAKVAGSGVVTGRSGSIGSVFYIEEDFWPLNTTLYVKDFHGNYPRFVFYLLNKFDLSRFSSGAGVPTLNRNHVHSELVYVPTRVAEQKQIVAILDEAFEGIDSAIANTEKNLANARELFESYLNAIFTRKGDDWVERQLKGVCVQITDGKHGDCRNEDNSGYFFLSAKDIKQNQLNYEGARQITKEDFEDTHRRTRLEPGDVLITNSGTIGRTAIAPENENTYRTTFQKSVAILKPIKKLISSEFCQYSLMAHLDEMVDISAGTAQKNLLLRDLRAHKFYMPESVQEQQAIANRLDEFAKETQRLEAIYQQKLAALNELKQSILQKAFSGELTAEVGDAAVEKVGAMEAA